VKEFVTKGRVTAAPPIELEAGTLDYAKSQTTLPQNMRPVVSTVAKLAITERFVAHHRPHPRFPER
jgi:hypothetical protein